MFVANTGSMALLFNEEGINTSGSLTKSIRKPNEMTAARARAVATIIGMAKQQSLPVGVVAGKVLSQSIPELQSFVQARGEAPSTNPVSLAIQAALLRATEIGLVSKTIDTDDDDALLIIEDSEQQHVDDNSAETSGILAPDTAAGLALLVGRIAERYRSNGGSGRLQDFVQALKNNASLDNFETVSYKFIADNATGDDEYYDYYKNLINTGGGGSTPTTSGGSTGNFWDNLFNNMDKVVDGITKVTGAINTTVGNVGGTGNAIIDKVNDIGGGIGAASISEYMRKNGLTIILVLVGLIILTIIISRAAKR